MSYVGRPTQFVRNCPEVDPPMYQSYGRMEEPRFKGKYDSEAPS